MESTTVAVLRRHPTAWVNVLLVVLIVGAAVSVFVLLNNDASANTTVRTATAVVGEVSSTVSASGTVDAATTKNLTFPAAGRITNVAVAVGDQVTAGQLLAQVDPTAADAAVATAKAAVATAQSALDQATFDRDQADTAYDDAVAAYADDSTTVQQARLTREAKRAALDAAQAALTKAQADLFDASVARLGTDLHAPVAGAITAVNNVVGDQSGTDPVIVLATLDQLVVSVSFSEVDAGKLQVGQVAQVTFPALTNVSASGKVAAVATTATTTDGVVSYAVTISLDSVPAGVRAGMSADVDVTTAVGVRGRRRAQPGHHHDRPGLDGDGREGRHEHHHADPGRPQGRQHQLGHERSVGRRRRRPPGRHHLDHGQRHRPLPGSRRPGRGRRSRARHRRGLGAGGLGR